MGAAGGVMDDHEILLDGSGPALALIHFFPDAEVGPECNGVTLAEIRCRVRAFASPAAFVAANAYLLGIVDILTMQRSI